MWDLSSLARKQTHNPLQWSLNYWTAKEIPKMESSLFEVLFIWKLYVPLVDSAVLGRQWISFLASNISVSLTSYHRGLLSCVLILSMNQQPRSIFMETLWPQDCIFSDTGIGSEGSSYKLLKMLSWNTALKKKKMSLPYQRIFWVLIWCFYKQVVFHKQITFSPSLKILVIEINYCLMNTNLA